MSAFTSGFDPDNEAVPEKYTVVSAFTGKNVEAKTYKKRPAFTTMHDWVRWNKPFVAINKDGVQGIVNRIEQPFVMVTVNGERVSWDWRDIHSVTVFEEPISVKAREFLKENAINPNKHLPILTSEGVARSVSMSYVSFYTDTGQAFITTPEGKQAYCGHDFTIEDIDLNLHQLKRLRDNAQEWLAHKNPFKVNDVVFGPGIEIGIVVAVYPQESDGTNYYNMDVVVGDFSLPTPVHSFIFKRYPQEKI